MTYDEWVQEIKDDNFFYDVRAMLDGLEAGCDKKSNINSWLKRKGYEINYKTYELKEIEDKK